MNGEPFHAGGVINLDDGETIKDFQLSRLPRDKLFIIEFVGLNAFVQPDQTLFIALQVHTNAVRGIYPIVPNGTATFSDPLYPYRIFGSQQVRLYADPNSDLTVTVARDNDNKDARAFVDLSGRIMAPSKVRRPSRPRNLPVS